MSVLYSYFPNVLLKAENDEIVETFQEVCRLFNEYKQSKHSSSSQQMMHRLSEINRKYRLNDVYCLIMPILLNEVSMKCATAKQTSLGSINRAEEGHDLTDEDHQYLINVVIDRFDDATKTLIICSRKIAASLKFNQSVIITSAKINALKLVYQHCWQYLCPHSYLLLPPFECVFELEPGSKQSEYLHRLMDEFGLIVLHKQYIELIEETHEWEGQMNLNGYVNDYLAVEEDDFMFVCDDHLLHTFRQKWMLNMLKKVNKTQFQLFMKSNSQSFQNFEAATTEMMQYFIQIDGHSVLRQNMIQLKKNDALHLLHGMFHHCDERERWINFVSLFCFVLINKEQNESLNASETKLNQQRCRIVAESAYFWRLDHEHKAVRSIRQLAIEPLFCADLWTNIQKIMKYDIVENSAAYLGNVGARIFSSASHRIWFYRGSTNGHSNETCA